MAGEPLIRASSESLETLTRLRAQRKAIEAKRLATLNVFDLIGYEPNCAPRFAIRKKAADLLRIENAFDSRVTEVVKDDLPPLCGECPQELFHAATEDAVLFGGAAGGGKSVALVAEGIKWCARYPGLRVLLVRRSYDELAESILPALRKFDFARSLGGKWNGVKFELRFPQGSYFTLRYLETLDDASRRQGGSVQLLLVDEYGLMVPGVVGFLRYERLRSDGSVPVVGMRATSNPGGASHGEVKALFVEPTDYGRRVHCDENGSTVRFIPSTALDNFHIDGGYLKRLDAIPDPNRRAAMRDGDWDTFAGAVFPELSQERHVLEPMELPAGWQRFCSVDWGFTKPWAVLHAALDEDGRVWVYREIYQTQVGEAEQARRILESEGPDEHITVRYADDAMWAVRGDAVPLAAAYGENGVHLTQAGKGPGSRVQGWQRIHSYLAEAPACPHHRSLGWTSCPLLHIFSNCRNLYTELKNLPYSTTGLNTEDADPKASDHACLVAGTLVETSGGPRPIDRIRAGDYVQTRQGLRRVLAAGMTARHVPVGTVLFSNGTHLRGTANHPVWVQGHGWKRLDALRYSDIISACQEANPSLSTGSPTGGTQIPKTGPTGCTSHRGRRIRPRGFSASIKRSGRPHMARSRLGITSTTRTRTPSITIPAIWSASPKPSIMRTTPPNVTTGRLSGSRSWMRSGLWLLSGTVPPKAGRGIANTASRSQPSGALSLSECVSSVAASTRPAISSRAPQPGSAQTTARRSGAASRVSTTRRGHAQPVAKTSWSTSTRASVAAPVCVAREFVATGRADVHNLTVEGVPEFYANGVLVHNCDALRYLLINLGGGPTFFESPPPAQQSGSAELLTPMGQWAVREDPNAPVSADPDKPKAGLTQTWEQALAGQRGPGGT